MKQFICYSLLSFSALICHGQEYTSASVFSHNDYVQPNPFYGAYNSQVGFIEADIFLLQDKLMVAHSQREITKEKTLEALYLIPLQKEIAKNNGFAYPDKNALLTLMIDIKTEGVPTLTKLVDKLKNYPSLISCKTLQIAISGNVPDPARWKDFPDYIHFDGRPGIQYNEDQLKRISFISDSFNSYSTWDGKRTLTKSEFNKIAAVRDAVHAKGKKLRFWATPDSGNAWMTLMNLKIDIIASDNAPRLVEFLKSKPTSAYQNTSVHQVYTPVANFTGKTPKNIILMIGDGMGLTQLYSGYTANQGRLNIFNIQNIGLSVTVASDSYITDSAAGATAIAAGKKTNNRFVGVDSIGNKLPSITEKLKPKGYKIAIISNGDITDATPASFYAHQPERDLSENIAKDFLSSKSDILIGGGEKAFKNRKDGADILSLLAREGYTVSQEYSSIDTIKRNKFVILDDDAVVSKIAGRKDFLSRSLNKSLSVFSEDSKPFFIMEEGAQIDWGGHENNLEYVVREVLDFDQAIGEAMKFADTNGETLLIITADHETGGLSIVGGNMSSGYVHGNFSTSDHTAVFVPVFAYGPGSELFRGVYQNTEIYFRMLKALKLK